MALEKSKIAHHKVGYQFVESQAKLGRFTFTVYNCSLGINSKTFGVTIITYPAYLVCATIPISTLDELKAATVTLNKAG